MIEVKTGKDAARPETAKIAQEALCEQFSAHIPSQYRCKADRCPQRHRERLVAIERIAREGK